MPSASANQRFALHVISWKKTRLEVQNLITIVLRWPTWINSECKASFILKDKIYRSKLRLCISLKDKSAILRDKKKKTTKMYRGRASQKKKKEKIISHVNINLFFLAWLESLAACSTPFNRIYNWQKKNFKSMELDSWLSSKLQSKKQTGQTDRK